MNLILVEQTASSDIPYIDLNHIMGPMWDSAPDFCHPEKPVFTAEVEWILFTIFSPMAPTTPAPKLIRFSDARVVYLMQDGLVRPFPNGGTFMKMGFDFSDVTVIPATNRIRYVIGEILPSQ
jgi:hypothetical protein